mmetsp:Transcript_11926/g.51158  ORF Transcript_11926/g.51158 Transcript_11926/m.51158 type:complete len:286 (-) Transcript_11926:193-1050(-)
MRQSSPHASHLGLPRSTPPRAFAARLGRGSRRLRACVRLGAVHVRFRLRRLPLHSAARFASRHLGISRGDPRGRVRRRDRVGKNGRLVPVLRGFQRARVRLRRRLELRGSLPRVSRLARLVRFQRLRLPRAPHLLHLLNLLQAQIRPGEPRLGQGARRPRGGAAPRQLAKHRVERVRRPGASQRPEKRGDARRRRGALLRVSGRGSVAVRRGDRRGLRVGVGGGPGRLTRRAPRLSLQLLRESRGELFQLLVLEPQLHVNLHELVDHPHDVRHAGLRPCSTARDA